MKKMCDEPKKLFVNLNTEHIKKNKLNIICGMPCCEASRDSHKLLNHKKIKFYCALWDYNKQLIEHIEKEYEHWTCPLIFLDGNFVGGYRELKHRIGKVDKEAGGETNMEKIKKHAVDLKNKAQPTLEKIAKKTATTGHKIAEKTHPMVEKVKEKTKPVVDKMTEKSKPLIDDATGKTKETKEKESQPDKAPSKDKMEQKKPDMVEPQAQFPDKAKLDEGQKEQGMPTTEKHKEPNSVKQDEKRQHDASMLKEEEKQEKMAVPEETQPSDVNKPVDKQKSDMDMPEKVQRTDVSEPTKQHKADLTGSQPHVSDMVEVQSKQQAFKNTPQESDQPDSNDNKGSQKDEVTSMKKNGN